MSEGVTVVTGAVEREGVKLSRVRVDGGTQMRAGLDADVVAAYVEVFQQAHAWGEFPPVTLFYDGTDYWVGDGFHRLAAYREVWGDKNPSNTVQAVVIPGTRRDAILHAAGANASHGLRRTNADKWRAVEVLLRDEEWQSWSNGEIARRCAVSDNFVGKVRSHLTPNGSESPMLRRGADGRVINTGNIGARPQVDGVDGMDGRRAGRGETEEELRQRIRETDRRWKEEINGRYAAQAAQAGPAMPPIDLMPIEEWELAEFVERVAGEVYGESAPRSERAWNAMTVSARSMTGEFWAKLRRTLAPFDVVDGRLQVAVYELVKGWKDASGENGQRSTGNGQLSTAAPSAEARRFGQEVKAATWGGVQRDDRPMVTAEGLANSLRGWAAQKAASALRTAAEYRGGAVWFEARQIVSGLNYRDKELVAALGMLAEEVEGERGGEGEEENGQLSTVNGQLSMEERDPWVAACGRVQSRQKTAEALAVAIMPWIEAYQDKYGRGWREIAERGNPAHTNSVLWDDIKKEAARRQLVVDDLTFKAAIKQAFSWLGASDNPLLSDGGDVDGEDEESHEDAKALRGHEEEEEAVDAVPVSLRDGYDSDEWYTPRWVIEAARKVMGEIDLDPASCALAQDVVQAGLFWSKTQGGERMGWFGRVWLNPPYSAPPLFVEKLMAEYTSGNVKQAVVLLNNATETGWFQALLARFPVCFLSKRLAFWRHDHADVGARQGQAVFYLGPDVERFCEVFGEFGIVVRRVD